MVRQRSNLRMIKDQLVLHRITDSVSLTRDYVVLK